MFVQVRQLDQAAHHKDNVAEAGNAGSASPLQESKAPEGAILAAIRGIKDPAAKVCVEAAQ